MYVIYLPVHCVGVTDMSPHYNLSPALKTYRQHRHIRSSSRLVICSFLFFTKSKSVTLPIIHLQQWNPTNHNSIKTCKLMHMHQLAALNKLTALHRQCRLQTRDSRCGPVDQSHQWQPAFQRLCDTWQSRQMMDEAAPCTLKVSLPPRSTLCMSQ